MANTRPPVLVPDRPTLVVDEEILAGNEDVPIASALVAIESASDSDETGLNSDEPNLNSDEPSEQELFEGVERRSGGERRVAKLTNGKFGSIERRNASPFGRRRSDRAV